MSLFRTGDFTLASGSKAGWKIECDTLTPDDWAAIALMAVEAFGRPGGALGVPRGGVPFAHALASHTDPTGPQWIVDDVCTTGGSIERYRERIGLRTPTVVVVAFARPGAPDWIKALFTMAGL